MRQGLVIGVLLAVGFTVAGGAQTLKCDCTVFNAVITPTVSLGDGSVGSPAAFFTSDPSHGFYHVSSGVIGLGASIYAGTDATYSLGTTTGNRFLNGFFSGVVVGATVQVGAGAASTSNITLRSSDAAGILSVELGDVSAIGGLRVGRIAAGTSGDITFASTHTTFWNFLQAYTGGDPATSDLLGDNLDVSLTPSGNVTKPMYASWVQVDGTTTHNFGTVGGLYGTSRMATSGTITELVGVTADGEVGGSGTATLNEGLKVIAGGFGTANTTTNRGISVSTPFTGGTVTNHYGVFVDDQTLGGTTIDYAWYYNAPSSHASIVTAPGTWALYGATPTANSPLRVGATLSSVLVNNGNTGTAQTIDLSKGNVQRSTLTGNVTFTLSNPVDGGMYELLLYTGAGSFTATWPAAVKWPAGTAPTITVTASRLDLIKCVFDATAADYFCNFWQNFTP